MTSESATKSLRPVTVGVDGCRGGWIAVTRSGDEVRADRLTDLRPLLHELRTGAVAAIAIDMPIGLLDDRPRTCDIEARKILGPRRSSVFPAPVRSTLDAVDYAEACERSRAASGKALSKQAFNLIPKIAEVDALVRPEDQDRFVEAHPECAFVRLAGVPLTEPKRTAQGQAMRRQLLRDHHEALDAAIDAHPQLPTIDLIDAAVLTITAEHVVNRSERRLGNDVDRTGLRAVVVY